MLYKARTDAHKLQLAMHARGNYSETTTKNECLTNGTNFQDTFNSPTQHLAEEGN
jgi:hypothetical protein